jgi:hypothetical protein
MSIKLERLLEQIPKDTMERVDRTRKQIGSSIRDAIRRETGLMLQRRGLGSDSESRENISAPVFLEAGLPTILSKVEFEDDYWLILLISPYKADLEKMATSSARVSELFNKLASDSQGEKLLRGRDRSLPPVRALTEELLALMKKDNPVKRILEVNEDVLGVYRYRLPPKSSLFPQDPMSGEIILYWGVIGLVAGLLGVTIEDLTIVVLAHEFGHAYTHMGADIDGHRWPTNSFSLSEHGLKEGLAQYYTHQVCLRLQKQFFRAHEAYKELLKNQPQAYKTHEPWLKAQTPEEVRLAMLETRRGKVGAVQDFNRSLKSAQSTLRSPEGEKNDSDR